MNKRNRERLLSIARLFDWCALKIRAYVKDQTPKRPKRAAAAGTLHS